jgi:hypothetical protein
MVAALAIGDAFLSCDDQNDEASRGEFASFESSNLPNRGPFALSAHARCGDSEN